MSECLQNKNLRPAEERIGKFGQCEAGMIGVSRLPAFCFVVTESQRAMV